MDVAQESEAQTAERRRKSFDGDGRARQLERATSVDEAVRACAGRSADGRGDDRLQHGAACDRHRLYSNGSLHDKRLR